MESEDTFYVPKLDGTTYTQTSYNKMRTDYPKDYKGPKAGLSDNQEWLEVTEFQAYKYMVFGIWKFSDFDCWLGARDDWHYNRGREAHKIH